MQQAAGTVRSSPSTFKAMFMAMAGIGLLLYVVSGWLASGSEATISAYDTASSGPVAVSPSGPVAAVAMMVGFVLLLVACIVLLQSRRGLSSSALRDPLTGLYTRLYAGEALPGLAARDDRDGHSRLVLVQVEVEAIDEVRCRYGSEAVALVLGSVGRHIRSQTREDDLPIEPDGDGFPIYLHCEDIDQARAFCRRLGTLLRSEQLDWHGDVIKVSAAMQITARRMGESVEALQERAGAALEPDQAGLGGRIEA